MSAVTGGISLIVATGLEANLPRASDNTQFGRALLTTDTHRMLFGMGAGATPVPLNVRMEDVIGLLTGGGKIRPEHMPAVALTEVKGVATIAERDALLASSPPGIQAGDMVVVAQGVDGQRQSFVLDSNGVFIETTGEGAVQSIAGKSGAVVLTTDDIDETATRLYYTDQRVAAFIATIINEANGLAGLDGSGHLFVNALPPTVVTEGDDATRLGSGSAPAGALYQSDGAGGTVWSTSVDGGKF